MHASFYEELEKIAKTSEDPEVQNTRKSWLQRHGKSLAIGAGVLGGGALLGGLAHAVSRSAGRRVSLGTGLGSGGSYRSSPFSAGPSAGASAGASGASRSRSSWDDVFKKAQERAKNRESYQKAYNDYHAAGGSGGWTRGRKASKDQYDAYKKAGDKYWGPDDSHWKSQQDFHNTTYKRWNEYHKDTTGGRGPGSGYGGSGSGSSYGRSSGSTGGGYSAPPPRPKGPTPGTHIPGMDSVKTKLDAKKAYRAAAMKNHPDRGGSTETMQQVNAEWEAFKNSPAWEKLAVARYWSAIASALIR